MTEHYDHHFTGSEHEELEITTKIETIMDSVNQLKRDVNKLINQMDVNLFNQLADQMYHLVHEQNEHWSMGKRQIDQVKQEIIDLKDQTHEQFEKQKVRKPHRSEYRQLQNMLQTSKYSDSYQYHNHPQSPVSQNQNTTYVRQNSNVPKSPPSSSGRTSQAGYERKYRSFQQNQTPVNQTVITSKRHAGENHR